MAAPAGMIALDTNLLIYVQGPRIFDVQIALTAFENGASEIWTHDRNFTAFPGLVIHDPL